MASCFGGCGFGEWVGDASVFLAGRARVAVFVFETFGSGDAAAFLAIGACCTGGITGAGVGAAVGWGRFGTGFGGAEVVLTDEVGAAVGVALAAIARDAAGVSADIGRGAIGVDGASSGVDAAFADVLLAGSATAAFAVLLADADTAVAA